MKTKPLAVPENWKDLKPHPLAMLVPYGQGIQTAELAGHMMEHGYDPSEPIVLFDGWILDGRHRLVAAQEAGVTPTFVELVEGDLVAFIAKKLHRQHLSDSQRSFFVEKLEKTRREAPDCTECSVPNTTVSERAKKAEVSPRTQAHSAKVVEQASEEVQQAVGSGAVPVGTAARAISTVFCRNCRIRGHKKNCQDCVATRKSMGVSVLKPPIKPKPKKNGSEMFDWRGADKAFGIVIRGVDAIRKAYGGNDEHEQCIELLRQFRTVFSAWKARVLGVKSPWARGM